MLNNIKADVPLSAFLQLRTPGKNRRKFTMDALKLIAQDSLKSDAPVIEIGDTIKV